MMLIWVDYVAMDTKDSKILLSYICILHILAVPVLFFGMTRQFASFYILFLTLNTVWIILSAITIGLVYGGSLGEESRVSLTNSTLHQSLFCSYFVVGIILELAVLIILWRIHWNVPVDL